MKIRDAKKEIKVDRRKQDAHIVILEDKIDLIIDLLKGSIKTPDTLGLIARVIELERRLKAHISNTWKTIGIVVSSTAVITYIVKFVK